MIRVKIKPEIDKVNVISVQDKNVFLLTILNIDLQAKIHYHHHLMEYFFSFF